MPRDGDAARRVGDPAFSSLLPAPCFNPSHSHAPGADPFEAKLEFMRRVRSLVKGSVPAIALTAYARDEDRLPSLEAGFQLHVAKPYSFPDLVAAIATVRDHANSVEH